MNQIDLKNKVAVVTGTASGECYNRPLYMPPNGGKIILKIKGESGTINPNTIMQSNTTPLTKYYVNTTNPIQLSPQKIVIIEITNITTGLPEEILLTTNDILLDFKVFDTLWMYVQNYILRKI